MEINYMDLQAIFARSGCMMHIDRASDGGDQLVFSIPEASKNRWLFGIAERSPDWYLIGLGGLFRIGRVGHLRDLCAMLIKHTQTGLLGDNTIEMIIHKFELEGIDIGEWRRRGETRRIRAMEEKGWHELTLEEAAHAWEAFSTKLSFRPSIEPSAWPSIREPADSTTWGVAGIHDLFDSNRPLFDKVEASLRERALTALKACIDPSELAFGLDYQRRCYSFSPHPPLAPDAISSWPLSVVPIGTYYVVASTNFQNGWFAHPWEKSICLFGRMSGNDFLSEYAQPIRRAGNTIRATP